MLNNYWVRLSIYSEELWRSRGRCYPTRPYAEADNTLRDLHNYSDDMKAGCRPSSYLLAVLTMLLHNSLPWNEQNFPLFCGHNQKNSNTSPGLLCWRFHNLAFLQHDFRHQFNIAKFFQVWSTIAGYDQTICGWDFCQLETEKYILIEL